MEEEERQRIDRMRKEELERQRNFESQIQRQKLIEERDEKERRRIEHQLRVDTVRERQRAVQHPKSRGLEGGELQKLCGLERVAIAGAATSYRFAGRANQGKRDLFRQASKMASDSCVIRGSNHRSKRDHYKDTGKMMSHRMAQPAGHFLHGRELGEF